MEYRRLYMPGGTFFFTLITYQRRKIFDNARNINLLREIIRKVKLKHPFEINAFVLLPDHLHCIWTLPENDYDFSCRWRLIKGNFTRECQDGYKELWMASRKRKQEQCIWQRRFWEHQIRDENDFANHVDYIHYNPVKHGYVAAPSEWPYSSFHRYVREMIYPVSWGTEKPMGFNEKSLGE